MNDLTTYLENFRLETFKTYNKSTQETTIRAAISFLNSDKLSVEADYNLDLFQFKAIFENNTALAEISRFRNSGTITNIFYRALCMFKGSESEIQEAVNICLDVIKKTHNPRIPYEFLVCSIADIIFDKSFKITQNREVLKVICNSYLDDVMGDETPELLTSVIRDFYEMLSFSYKGEENNISLEYTEYLFVSGVSSDLQRAGMSLALDKFYSYRAINILVLILKRHDYDTLVDYLTKGSSISGITDLTLAFENKDEVFEIIDKIEENKIDYYKGNFSIPKGSYLTDEDLQIYGELLNSSEVIDNVTIEQAISNINIFKAENIINHKDFTLELLNLFETPPSLIKGILINTNYTQDELIKIASKLTIHQLKASYCLITPELFKAVNDSNYELQFIYESQEPLGLFIGNSISRKKFNIDFISDIKKVYKCSSGDIFKNAISYRNYNTNMDKQTQKTFEAFSKIYND